MKELLDHAGIERSHTTVGTILDRLHAKGLTNRIEEQRAFRYTPRLSQADWRRRVACDSIRQILAMDASTSRMLSFLVEAITEYDARLLDELERLVLERRQRLGC